MDSFFDAIYNREFSMEIDYNTKRICRIYREEYLPELTILGVEDGVFLQTESLFYTFGRENCYLWKEGAVYCMPQKSTKEIEPFWDYMNRYKYDDFFVGKVELPAFCRQLLPVLERHYRVEKQQFQEEDFLPPKPEYEIYLDSPERDMIDRKSVV